MKTHSNFASRIFGILAIAVTVGWLQPTAAYGQTAEGVVIANTATVSFDDGNGNSYGGVFATANVTVGHAAGIDVAADQATATPLVNSTGNTMEFYVTNAGNGVDSVSVAENISDGSVLTVTQFTYNATTYANIGLLNTALADSAIVAGGSVTIEVEYSIADDTGGELSTYTLTGTSRRDGGVRDNDFTDVTPALTGTVAVTPDGGLTLRHLPSNGTNYTFVVTVTNNQTGADDFDLLVTSPGSSVITTVSVNAIGGDSTRVNIGAGAAPTFNVVYSVAGVATNTDTLYVEARSVTTPATTDSGFADITVIEADLSIAKVAYRDNQSTLIGSNLVLPNEFNQNFADDVPRWPVTTRNDHITCVFTAFSVTQAVPVRLLQYRDIPCILP